MRALWGAGVSLSVGTRLGPYEITALLGAGGMGEVYRARDTRLGREVALKIVPPDLVHDEAARKRFHQEARSLSALSHPNIATLYEFDSDHGTEFLIMELVNGTRLRERLAGGALPVKEVLSLGAQMAHGLEAAHEAGIVHRDLKPENLIVTPKGLLKILDFGLARYTAAAAAAGATASFATEVGSTPGTLPYMAPEQLQGEEPTPRFDIYAAGAVLYEMATGRAMFDERGPMLVEAILHREPLPPIALNPRVPSQLSDTILKAIDKDPERRYQSARELAIDLERAAGPATRPTASPRARRHVPWKMLAAGIVLVIAALSLWMYRRMTRAGSAPIQSLAVLPLENFSGDAKQEYFVDGMTEELTSELAKIGGFSVISRTSAMQYKGTKKILPQIARELNVDAVIEGSVFREGNRVRITAQLVDARTDRHLWSNSFEEDVGNALDLQTRIANAIAEQVQNKLAPSSAPSHAPQTPVVAAKRTVAPEVLDLYLRGLYQANQGTADSIKAALASFQQATAKDPSFAPAYAQIAGIQLVLGTSYVPPREIMPQAKANAGKAIALDDTLVIGHVALAGVKFLYEWDWPGTERELQRALALDKNSADAHDQYGQYLIVIGRPDEGIAELQRARELDPFSSLIGGDLVFWSVFARKYDFAIESSKKAIELGPQASWTRVSLGLAYAMKGQYERAVAEAETGHKLDDNPLNTSFLASIYARAGRRKDAERTLASLSEQLKTQYSCSYEVAVVYVELGNLDEAFRYFNQAYEQRADCMPLLKVDPRLDKIHNDPRYQELMRKVGFTP
jgi:eukaryotic-like serine/threonine-protein kinase